MPVLEIQREVVDFTELNWEEIRTPIRVPEFNNMLKQAGYDNDKRNNVINGFLQGFDIGYCGPTCRRNEAHNLPLRIGDSIDLWNKVMKEVELKRYAGPFDKLPVTNWSSAKGW